MISAHPVTATRLVDKSAVVDDVGVEPVVAEGDLGDLDQCQPEMVAHAGHDFPKTLGRADVVAMLDGDLGLVDDTIGREPQGQGNRVLDDVKRVLSSAFQDAQERPTVHVALGLFDQVPELLQSFGFAGQRDVSQLFLGDMVGKGQANHFLSVFENKKPASLERIHFLRWAYQDVAKMTVSSKTRLIIVLW